MATAAEHFASDCLSASLDLYRDLRDAAAEAAFYQVYGNMLTLSMADERAEMKRQAKFDPRALPAVRQVLETIDEGGRREGLARIAMLISRAGGGKHRLSQLQRVREIIAHESDTGSMSEDERRRLLQEETIVVEFEPLRAWHSLPKVLRTANERRRAHRFLDAVASHAHLEDRQRALVAEIRAMLPLPSSATRGRAGIVDTDAAAPAPARRFAKNAPRQPRRAQRNRTRVAS